MSMVIYTLYTLGRGFISAPLPADKTGYTDEAGPRDGSITQKQCT